MTKLGQSNEDHNKMERWEQHVRRVEKAKSEACPRIPAVWRKFLAVHPSYGLRALTPEPHAIAILFVVFTTFKLLFSILCLDGLVISIFYVLSMAS